MNHESVFQRAIISRFAEEISSGILSVRAELELIAEMNVAFPMGLNRIEWTGVPDSYHSDASGAKSAPAAHLSNVRDFFGKFMAAAQLSCDSRISIVGDSVTNVEFQMPLRFLRDHLMEFIELPQSTYILTERCMWCFNYTFEDQMYFGRRPAKNPLL